MASDYARPPITQAIIELKFAKPASIEEVRKAQARLKSMFPKVDETAEVSFGVLVQPGAVPHFKQTPNGFKGRSEDATQELQLTLTSLSAFQHPPYPGWESFTALLSKGVSAAVKTCGDKSLERIGVRFINRIDVPIVGPYETKDYLNADAAMPNFGFTRTGFLAQCETSVGSKPFGLRIAVGTTESPLLDHQSLMIDLDFWDMADLPRLGGDILGRLSEMRVCKNEVFESLITDKTRDLIRASLG